MIEFKRDYEFTNDHCMDALRYFVKTKRLVVKKQHQKDSWLS